MQGWLNSLKVAGVSAPSAPGSTACDHMHGNFHSIEILLHSKQTGLYLQIPIPSFFMAFML